MADRRPFMRRHVSFNPSRPTPEHVRHASIAVPGSEEPVDIDLRRTSTAGPISFFNPTKAIYAPPSVHRPSVARGTSDVRSSGSSTIAEDDVEKAKAASVPFPGLGDDERARLEEQVQFQWRSRDNRKGRHSLVVIPPKDEADANYITPPPSSSFHSVVLGFKRMLTVFPYWDISYLVALAFTIGSLDWCLNAFFVWLPLVAPSTEFHDEILTAGGATAFIGATIFEIGSWLLFFEAVNENHSSCFGWELEQKLEKGGLIHVRPEKSTCRHHHQMASGRRKSVDPEMVGPDGQDGEWHAWQWFPSWNMLRTHYLHELGFLASFIQLLAASVFWISGIAALPGIINHIDRQAVLNGVYWIPQIVGGSGFILSGLLFTLETQPNWYTPAPHILGWWVGAWNFVGGVGFTLCGCLGPAYGNSGAEYQASLATFWGSWSFLIGSMVQWYESLDKYPVEVEGRVGGSEQDLEVAQQV